MILINFHGRLTPDQVEQLSILVHQPLEGEIRLRLALESEVAIQDQALRLAQSLTLQAEDIARQAIVAYLPDQPWQAAILLTALRARLGFFPWVMRTRMALYSVPPRLEIAGVYDLETLYRAASA